jgi:hypothetical protein
MGSQKYTPTFEYFITSPLKTGFRPYSFKMAHSLLKYPKRYFHIHFQNKSKHCLSSILSFQITSQLRNSKHRWSFLTSFIIIHIMEFSFIRVF